jgi:hypothetical protein
MSLKYIKLLVAFADHHDIMALGEDGGAQAQRLIQEVWMAIAEKYPEGGCSGKVSLNILRRRCCYKTREEVLEGLALIQEVKGKEKFQWSFTDAKQRAVLVTYPAFDEVHYGNGAMSKAGKAYRPSERPAGERKMHSLGMKMVGNPLPKGLPNPLPNPLTQGVASNPLPNGSTNLDVTLPPRASLRASEVYDEEDGQNSLANATKSNPLPNPLHEPYPRALEQYNIIKKEDLTLGEEKAVAESASSSALADATPPPPQPEVVQEKTAMPEGQRRRMRELGILK